LFINFVKKAKSNLNTKTEFNLVISMFIVVLTKQRNWDKVEAKDRASQQWSQN